MLIFAWLHIDVLFRFWNRKKVTIISYHNPTVAVFLSHIEYLMKKYVIISMNDFLSKVNLPNNSLIITFDDGHKGNVELLPLIKKYNLTPVIYLCSQVVATNHPFWWKCLKQQSVVCYKKCTNKERLRLLKDKKLYYPEMVVSPPHVFILFADNFNFYSLYLPSVYIWCIGLALYWLVGYILSLCLLRKTINNKTPFKQKIYIPQDALIFSSIIALLVDLGLVYAAIKIAPIGSDEFKDFCGTGLIAHMAVYLRFVILWFICADNIVLKRNIILKWFVILSTVFYAVAYSTKGSIVLVLLSVIIIRKIILNKSMKIFHLLLLVISSLFVFFISYSIVFGYAAPWNFIFNHTFFYFVSSIASFSQYCKINAPIDISVETLFMPVVNFYYKLMGIPLEKVYSDLWTAVGPGMESNVKTFFGTIFIYGGIWGGIFTVIVYSLVGHLLLVCSLKKNQFALFLYCICLAALTLGWFDLFFNMIAFYEYIIFAILLSLVYAVKKYYIEICEKKY